MRQKERIRVLKFGGAALRDGAGIRRAAGLVRRFGGKRPVLVVSAVLGVTDLLQKALEGARRGELVWDAVRVRHRSLLSSLGLPGDLLDRHLFDLRAVLSGLAQADAREQEPDRRLQDFVLSFGERMSARIVAGLLSKEGQAAVPVDAYDVGLVVQEPGALTPPRTAAASVHRALVGGPAIPVVTGFVALDEAGDVTTLGPNGSDLSAVWIGAALDAEEVQLWKEVPGILRADPNLIPGAELLQTIGRVEAIALARHGAGVLHPAAILPALDAGLDVWLRDVRDPEGAGTRVVPETRFAGPLAIAHREGLTLIELVGGRRPSDIRESSEGTSSVLAELLESFQAEGIELVGCQAGPARIRMLIEGPGTRAIPPALQARARIVPGRACVAVVGRDLGSGGDTAARLLALARTIDPQAAGWIDGSVACVLVDESGVADVVKGSYREFFGLEELDRSPAVG